MVSLAAGDLTGADRDRATTLITDCTECATLHDDLLAIAQATAALPTAVRTRDFQLSPEQAARLRPMGWRRLVGAFASPRLAMTRQLGIGLTTLGLAGLLVSVLPAANLPGAASGSGAPAQAGATTEDARLPAAIDSASAAPSAAASASEAAASASAASSSGTAGPLIPAATSASSSYGALSQPGSSPSQDRTSAYGDGSGGNVAAQGSNGAKSTTPAPGQRELAQVAAEQSGPSLILVASAILLAAGIALLVVRRIARGLTER